MSQIETIMLVVLGFVVAALAALIISRIGWSFAVKLGNRRTERDAPARIAALQAERDQLRAEYAMLQRKLELRLDDLKTRLAEQTAEVTRNRNRIDHMVAEVQNRDTIIAEREADVRAIHEQIAPLEEELAIRTQNAQQLKEQLSDRDDEITRLRAEIASLHGVSEQKDHKIHSLQEEVDQAPTVPELTGQAQETQNRLHERIAQLTSLSTQIEQQREELQTQHHEFTAKQTELLAATEAAKSKAAAKKTRRKSKTTATKSAAKKKPAAKKSAEKPQKTAESKPRKRAARKPRGLGVIEKGGKVLENKLESAEKESRNLQAELSKLDEIWTEKLDELKQVAGDRKVRSSEIDSDVNVKKSNGSGSPDSDGEADGQDDEVSGGRSFQNVISLAARIRALQRKAGKD